MAKKPMTQTDRFFLQCQKQALRDVLHVREVPAIVLTGGICSILLVCAALGGIVLASAVYILMQYGDVEFARTLRDLNGTPSDMLGAYIHATRNWFAAELAKASFYVALMTPFFGVIIRARLKADRLFLKPRISTT